MTSRLIKVATPIGLSVLIILVVCLYVRGRARVPPPSAMASMYIDAMEGDRLCRPDGGAWASPGSTAFVFAVSATCSACTATKTFDEEVYEYAMARRLPVYFALSERQENRSRVQELTSAGRKVVRVKSLQDLGLARIPTIARVDDHGVIQSRWTGTVPENEHDAVLASVTSGQGMQTYRRIEQSEMKRFALARHAQVLAFSGLTSDPELVTKIIPAAEVYIRAKHELDPNIVTVIDCASTLSAHTCQEAGLNLAIAHFREVVVSGLPARPSVCPTK